MGIFDLFKSKTKKEKIIDKYYLIYPEKPFISDNRVFDEWERLVKFDPTKLVSIDKMTRNADGLLPGHVYQIYWIDKYTPERRIPVYFEYEYGIDFNTEKAFLERKGYIKDFQATQKGKDILKKYKKIIDEKNNQNKRPKLNLKKELAEFDKEQKELAKYGIESHDDRNEKIGFVHQSNAITDYQDGNYDEAKKGLIKAMEKYNFYTPGGVEYLAKIYRKEKNYQSEIEVVEKGLEYFEKHKDQSWSVSTITNLNKRLVKAKQLADKQK